MLNKTFNLYSKITKIYLQNDILFVGSDSIFSIDIESGNIIEKYNTNEFEYPSSLFVNDFYIFAGYENGTIIQINISTKRIINILEFNNSKVYNIFSKDNLIFSSSYENKLKIYDIDTHKIIKELDSDSGFECNFIISDDCLYYISDYDNTIIQYDILNDKIINKFQDYAPILYMFLHKTSNSLLISSSDEYIKSWNLTTKKLINIINLEIKFDFIYLNDDNNLYLSQILSNEIIKLNVKQNATPNAEPIIFTLPDNITGIVFSNSIIVSTIDGSINIYEDKIIQQEDTNEFNNIITNKINLKNEDYYKKVNCLNYNVFTLENYTSDDDPIQIYTLNNQNVFEISNCITQDELIHHLSSGKDTIHPTMLMSICTPRSNATGRIVINLPPNNLFYTYGSIEKLFLNKENKTWFALPLFGGKRRRIGNLDEAPLIGSLHCQIPGYKVYKLYTKEEIDQNIEIKETFSDYPMFLYNNISKLFELGNTNITKKFINNLIDNLLSKS